MATREEVNTKLSNAMKTYNSIVSHPNYNKILTNERIAWYLRKEMYDDFNSVRNYLDLNLISAADGQADILIRNLRAVLAYAYSEPVPQPTSTIAPPNVPWYSRLFNRFRRTSTSTPTSTIAPQQPVQQQGQTQQPAQTTRPTGRIQPIVPPQQAQGRQPTQPVYRPTQRTASQTRPPQQQQGQQTQRPPQTIGSAPQAPTSTIAPQQPVQQQGQGTPIHFGIRLGIAFAITLLMNFLFYRPIIVEGLGFGDTPYSLIFSWIVPLFFGIAVYAYLPTRLEEQELLGNILPSTGLGLASSLLVFALFVLDPFAITIFSTPTLRFGIPIIVFFVTSFIARRDLQHGLTLGHTSMRVTGALLVTGFGLFLLNMFVTGAFLNIETYLRPIDVLKVIGVQQGAIDNMKQSVRNTLSFLGFISVQPVQPQAEKIGGFQAVEVKFGSKYNDYLLPTLFAKMDYTLPVTIMNPNRIESQIKPVEGFYIDETFLLNGSNRIMCGTVGNLGKITVGEIRSEEERSLTIDFKSLADCKNIVATARGTNPTTTNPLFPVKKTRTASGGEFQIIQDTGTPAKNCQGQTIQGTSTSAKVRDCQGDECKEACNCACANELKDGTCFELDRTGTIYRKGSDENKCECKFKKFCNFANELCFMADNKAAIEFKANYNFSVQGKGEMKFVNKENDKRSVPKARITSSAGPLTVTTYFIPDIYSLDVDRNNNRPIKMFVQIDNKKEGGGSAKIIDFKIKKDDSELNPSCTPPAKGVFIDKSITVVCDANSLIVDPSALTGNFLTVPVIVDVNYTYSERYSTTLNVEKKFIPEGVIKGSDQYDELIRQFSSLPYFCPSENFNVHQASLGGIRVPPEYIVTGTVNGNSPVNVVYSALTVDIIDSYLKTNVGSGLSLRDQANNFYELGTAYGVDPAFAVAVAMHESGSGTSNAARNNNNYFGIMTFVGNTRQLRSFTTPREGIDQFYRTIKNTYIPIQDTPGEVTCWDENNNRYTGKLPGYFGCYCTEEVGAPSGTGCPTWFRRVTQIRSTILTTALGRQPTLVASGTYAWPTTVDTLTQSYSGGHKGLDIAGSTPGVSRGQPIYAAADGVVEGVFKDRTTDSSTADPSCGSIACYGNYVLVNHPELGKKSLYAHLDYDRTFGGTIKGVEVNVGDSVRKCQLIGRMGTTGNSNGPHLHFEIMNPTVDRTLGVRLNPLNPSESVFPARGEPRCTQPAQATRTPLSTTDYVAECKIECGTCSYEENCDSDEDGVLDGERVCDGGKGEMDEQDVCRCVYGDCATTVTCGVCNPTEQADTG